MKNFFRVLTVLIALAATVQSIATYASGDHKSRETVKSVRDPGI